MAGLLILALLALAYYLAVLPGLIAGHRQHHQRLAIRGLCGLTCLCVSAGIFALLIAAGMPALARLIGVLAAGGGTVLWVVAFIWSLTAVR